MIEFSDEQQAFRSVVRDFARRELAPQVERWEAAGELPLDAVAKMADLGLFGIVFPEQWGGSGGDFTSLCVAIEEIGRVDQAIGITLEAAVGLGINPILTYGTQEQKEQHHEEAEGAEESVLIDPGGLIDAPGTRCHVTLQLVAG